MAFEHHKMKRAQKLEALIRERDKLPLDFEPPKKVFASHLAGRA